MQKYTSLIWCYHSKKTIKKKRREYILRYVRTKKKCMILKVDFTKVYDLVNWNFLDYIFCRFYFGNKWRVDDDVCVMVIYGCW
jgi:hypothetical protein